MSDSRTNRAITQPHPDATGTRAVSTANGDDSRPRAPVDSQAPSKPQTPMQSQTPTRPKTPTQPTRPLEPQAPTQSQAPIHRAEVSRYIVDQGPFVIRFAFPGFVVPEAPADPSDAQSGVRRAARGFADPKRDHGYGPLATVAESFLEPGTWIPMHEHRNDEIISWVPAGVMRHDDRTVGKLVTDSDHLMVMNSGRSFRHEELTGKTDPSLRMLQIFVRPHTLDLEPGIQHGPIEAAASGEWRLLFGPEDSEAPFTVRNDIYFSDLRLSAGGEVFAPARPGYDLYLFCFEGDVSVGAERLTRSETALAREREGNISLIPIQAHSNSIVVAFLINPNAPVTRAGTIGR